MHYLIGLHAGFGELGALAFLWVMVEMFNPTEGRIRRAKMIALAGVVMLFLSWFAGGAWYLADYQSVVKNVIKSGPSAWAHSIITETKEHVFMFLPFLAIVVWGALQQYGNELIENKKNVARAILFLCAFIALLALAMAGMGFLISSGMRSALELKAL